VSWPSRPLLTIFAVAVLFKLALIVVFFGRLYPDVIGAVNLGKEVLGGVEGYRITSKTFVGPVLWYGVYHAFGIWGLKLVNLGLFAGLLALHARLGRKLFGAETVVLASVLFAFYPGTNLNVAVGEQDDLATLLFFALGIWRFVSRRDAFVPGLLIGIAFLFKFSAAVFALGFVLYLLVRRQPRAAAVSILGMALPFVLLNALDGLASARNLAYAFGIQQGFSSWRGVGFKLLSTGLLPAVALSWWVWWKRRDDAHLLFTLIPTAYLAYVILNRDAWAAGFVMMQGIFFASFPLAQLLADRELGTPWAARRALVGGALAAYLLIATSITLVNAIQDTELAAERKGPWVLCE
jgi:hypothetical protein